MGWFSRSQPDSQSGRRSTSRSQATEAQVAELRGKARRRLIGALVLVLTAVIFVPMLFDSAPPDESLPVPVVLPAVPSPQSTEMQVASVAQSPDTASGQLSDIPMPDSLAAQNSLQSSQQQAASPEATAPVQQADTGTQASQPASSAAAAQPVAKPAPAPAPARPTERTDDGSVAIALLEGKAPRQVSSAQEKGNFILQIAAYGTDKDAQARRERLVASGVTNAYVEQAVLNGKPTYRLRVGPFPTRDAAQAAQARLRALGYDNGFISTQ
jgi:DedD protein